MSLNLGRTLIIANPASHGGRGARGAKTICELLEKRQDATSNFELVQTAGPGDATHLAADAISYDTVLALGGDGVIHEVLQGLMRIDEGRRPTLGLIPYGSGNDYARTLGISANSPRLSLRQLLDGTLRSVDVGRVNDVYFDETLSFGIDAVIAAQASESHAQGEALSGTGHYADNGIKVILENAEPRPYRASFDGEAAVEGASLIFAVQVGPTYGGGFRITPDANPSDGELSVIYTQGHPNIPHALGLFGLARFGLHLGSKVFSTRNCRTLTLDFDEQPPAQADGEPIEGTHFEIECLPGALRVICNHEVSW